MDEPEFESVEAFVGFLLDEDRTTFCLGEVEMLSLRLQTSNQKVIAELKSYGLSMVERPVPKVVRGFQSNSHDRWYGPGACRTFGGSGWEQITGFAGQKG